MRMLLPGGKLRRRVRELLSTVYNGCPYPDFNEALRLLAEFSEVPAYWVGTFLHELHHVLHTEL